MHRRRSCLDHPARPPSRKGAQARGFTMIELVVVIVILGILAATAMPKLLDMRLDAQIASMNRLAGSLSSAADMNYARCQITSNVASGDKCVTVSNCTDVADLLQGGLPTALQGSPGTSLYILSQVLSTTANGNTQVCTLRLDDTATSTQVLAIPFQGVSAGH